MKKLSILFSLLIMFGCSKTATVNTPSGTGSNTPNTISVVDNGKTYSMSGYGYLKGSITENNFVQIAITRDDTLASIYISTTPKAGVEFDVYINSYYDGPANGIGVYKLREGTYKQNFTGGLSYKADSGIITTTTASSTHIAGTYKLYLKGGKIVTGDFDGTEVTFN